MVVTPRWSITRASQMASELAQVRHEGGDGWWLRWDDPRYARLQCLQGGLGDDRYGREVRVDAREVGQPEQMAGDQAGEDDGPLPAC